MFRDTHFLPLFTPRHLKIFHLTVEPKCVCAFIVLSQNFLKIICVLRDIYALCGLTESYLRKIISYSPLKHSKCKTVRSHSETTLRTHTATLTRNVSIFKQLSSKNRVLCAHTCRKNAHTDQQGLVFKSALIVCNCLDFFFLHNSYRCCFKSC